MIRYDQGAPDGGHDPPDEHVIDMYIIFLFLPQENCGPRRHIRSLERLLAKCTGIGDVTFLVRLAACLSREQLW